VEQRRVLLVKGTAGLGNRILSTLTAILYARLSGRDLVVDWRDPAYSQGGDNVFPRFFRCPAALSIETIAPTESVRPAIWRGHLHDPVRLVRRRSGGRDAWRELTIDLSRVDYDDDVLVMCTFGADVAMFRSHLDAAFLELRGRSTDDILAALLREDLLVHPDICHRGERFWAANFTGPTVGVHVRYSDHRGNLSGTLRRLDQLLRRDPRLQIFLCTDSRQVTELFQHAYQSLITAPRWYPAPGRTAHGRGSGGDRTEHGIEALVDLFLLGRCDYLVFDSSSSFARIARLRGGLEPTRVFDVTRGPKRGRRALTALWRFWRRAPLLDWRFRLLRRRLALERLLR
jgi:hypothetical protein